MKYLILIVSSIFLFQSCATTNTYKPQGSFSKEKITPKPDYNQLKYWAAHPDKQDNADSIPADYLKDEQAEAKADVFFVYPTIYTGNKKYHTSWNSDVNDEVLNKSIDDLAILNQASVFNGAAKIYSPYYRQAHINVYYDDVRKEDSKNAMELAYKDVKTAFEYYLKHYNNGRPIIMASHSQGTNHTEQLLKDFFDGKPLQKQLVTAYLIGMPIVADSFQNIKPCIEPAQTGCFCTWNAYARNHYPKGWEFDLKYSIATNPINWKIDETYADYSDNKGGVLSKFNIKENLSDAQVKDGMVWIGNPKVFGSFLLRTKRWHYAEYNLFYLNIRENAQLRVKSFLENNE